jgi:hypothetical protein
LESFLHCFCFFSKREFHGFNLSLELSLHLSLYLSLLGLDLLELGCNLSLNLCFNIYWCMRSTGLGTPDVTRAICLEVLAHKQGHELQGWRVRHISGGCVPVGHANAHWRSRHAANIVPIVSGSVGTPLVSNCQIFELL